MSEMIMIPLVGLCLTHRARFEQVYQTLNPLADMQI